MTKNRRFQTRTRAIVAATATTLAVACAHAEPLATPPSTTAADVERARQAHAHDWDWLVGRWTVRHHRLKERLAGCHEWEDFNGTSVTWLTMGGLGTADDNVLEIPSGTYRAMGTRAFDVKIGQWSIWWLDLRNPTMEPPVHGGFKDGTGTFVGDDTLRGKPVKVRFQWSKITPTTAHWEQAFSGDGGATWEVNWEMEFQRSP